MRGFILRERVLNFLLGNAESGCIQNWAQINSMRPAVEKSSQISQAKVVCARVVAESEEEAEVGKKR